MRAEIEEQLAGELSAAERAALEARLEADLTDEERAAIEAQLEAVVALEAELAAATEDLAATEDEFATAAEDEAESLAAAANKPVTDEVVAALNELLGNRRRRGIDRRRLGRHARIRRPAIAAS